MLLINFFKDKIQTLKSNYTTRYLATHKDECRCAAFSPDGRYAATGSVDTSVKLLDVKKMLTYSQLKKENPNDNLTSAKPVLKTFYDHTQVVYDLDFHPTRTILASSSGDNTIKLFEYLSSQKKAVKVFQDSHSVRSIKFHPSGRYILAGTDHPLLRLYDCETKQCFVSTNGTQDGHSLPVNYVSISYDGSLFASCSEDGTVKIWDGKNIQCVRIINDAHSSLEVSSVQFSLNGKYLLTGGRDCTARVWDVGTGNQVLSINYSKPSHPYHNLKCQSKWSYNEDFIIVSDESTQSALVYDTRTQELTQRLTGHNGPITSLGISPVKNHFITCSEDGRARFWVDEGIV